eukprot:scaffold283359_cov26-Tisochrysis_lutea.AAC.1
MASDTEALDALLNIQLRIVEQQIREANLASTDRPAVAIAKPPADVVKKELAEKQARLLALDEQNLSLERELNELAQARKRITGQSRAKRHVGSSASVLSPSRGDTAELRHMLRDSVQMHRELMDNVRAEREEMRRQRQWRDEWETGLEEEDEEAGLDWMEELDDILSTNADPQATFGGATFGGNQPAHLPQPPPLSDTLMHTQSLSVPEPSGGAGNADETHRSTLNKKPAAPNQIHDELLGEIERALEENAVSSDSEATSEPPTARRRPVSPNSEYSVGNSEARYSATASRPRTGATSVSSMQEEEEEEDPPPSDEELRAILESLFESAIGWLKRAIRPVVSSIVRDQVLKLDVWASEVGGGGIASRLIGKRPGAPKHSEEEKACSKLWTRAKSILDVITEAIPDAPGGMLSNIIFLTTRRICWPEGLLLPSVRATLDLYEDGGAAPTAESPAAIVLQLIAVRLVCEELLLRSKENQVAGKLSLAAQSNLKMVAAFLFAMFEMCIMQTEDSSKVRELVAAEHNGFAAGPTLYYSNPQRFEPHLGRICDHVLPKLGPTEGPALLRQFSERLLQAARAKAAALGPSTLGRMSMTLA